MKRSQFWTALARTLFLLFVMCLTVGGCSSPSNSVPDRRPRPVATEVLTKRLPPHRSMVSASVGSWKTERIGFEVGGRVDYVVEPNTEVDGRVYGEQGQSITKGTPIGQLESERYQLQVDKSKADVVRAEQTLLAANTELNDSIPAEIRAATASRDLAKTELDRSKRLFDQNAGAKGDVDRDKANYENALSRLKQLNASKDAKAAEVESLRNAVLQAKQSLKDAERNLRDCTLYSSFNGQIADISVVPGSVVQAGQPVVTLQMMNPIKIELEVSAEESRRLQRTERLPIEITMPDGSSKSLEGYLYLVDPVADSLTRTFTVTLLVLNEKLLNEAAKNVATTKDIWRLDFKFLPGAKDDMLFVAEDALLQDQQGPYLWQITNATINGRTPGQRDYKVRKLRVRKGGLRVPFLGNWVFQEVLVDDKQFDPKENMVIGKLNVQDGKPEEWAGDTVMFDLGGQWMLRPGDLVKVDLSQETSEAGYYVPLNAIVPEDNRFFIFLAEQDSNQTVAKRIEVKLTGEAAKSSVSSLQRVEPVKPIDLEGVQIITEGVHYLIDGEAIKPVGAG